MASVLAIDLGKTGCRAAWWADQRTSPGWSAAGQGAPGLANGVGAMAARAAIASVCKPILDGTSEVNCCVGAAGAAAAPRAAAELLDWLTSLPAVTDGAVCSDAVIAHAGGLGGEPGVLLLAGTGAVALAIDGSGMSQVDGWGPLLDDAGGGGWIGAAGLRAVLRAIDGRGAPTALIEAAVDLFGPVPGLSRLVGGHENPARLLASFAPLVAEAAEAGDLIAGQILAEAATELAGSALAAAGRSAAPAVALAGGLWNLGPSLTEPVVGALESSGLRVVPALGDALAGARLLAERRDTVLEPFVLRASDSRAGGGAGLPTVP